MNTPLTPQKPRVSKLEVAQKINSTIALLNRHWDLQLEPPKDGESPSRRERSLPVKCVFHIKLLIFNNAIDSVINRFEVQAKQLYSGWVRKSRAERGTLPEKSPDKPHPVSTTEREALLNCFLLISDEIYESVKGEQMRSPGSAKLAHITTSVGNVKGQLKDNPIPFPLKSPHSDSKESVAIPEKPQILDPKRSREVDEFNSAFKKPRLPAKRPSLPRSQSSSRSSGQVERGRRISHDGKILRSANTSASSRSSSIFDRDNNHTQQVSLPSAETSFASKYSRTGDSFNDSTLPSMTQESATTVDETEKFSHQPFRDPFLGQETDSSEFEGASSFEQLCNDSFSKSEEHLANPEVDDELSQEVMDHLAVGGATEAPKEDSTTVQKASENSFKSKEPPGLEAKLLESLGKMTFPQLPERLLLQPLCVRYEICRIYLHTGVSLSTFDKEVPRRAPVWTDYGVLWGTLKHMDSLKTKSFPERTSASVWQAALGEFHQGSRGVSMCGSLKFHDDSCSGPLFRLQLQPLRLEKTYRLRRRFGNDRFLELDIPNLTGRGVPKVLGDLDTRGKNMVIEWLLRDWHQFLGRAWSPFCCKPKESKELKVDADDKAKYSTTVDHRLFFFAVHGHGFEDNKGTPKESETVTKRSAMTIEALLNWLRPSNQNQKQSHLKLFARTALALSRNTATVVLERSQIRYKDDIYSGKVIMTDGAGRISQTLALKVIESLGLSFFPSGFQARLGDAKGFWTVDHTDKSGEDWIEVYKSQRKWTRKCTINDLGFHDPSHRTFEVNKTSGKLKSADLNLQLLPILIERAVNKVAMRKAISKILELGLAGTIDDLKAAMESPLLFRKWVRGNNATLSDRVAYGMVSYRQGLPVNMEERINLLLDAGFDPLKLRYLKELGKRLFEQRGEELKERMNITVPRSTYAYMVPDWTGTLEEDEVYLHLSEPVVEELSIRTGVPLANMDLLVARSPAHFVSDIQRVRAVSRPELEGLKDVIVFSVKGASCLAAKLSGGDYDGDMAWVCWESSIVDNFSNAEVPTEIDLVAEGHIDKNITTYEALVKGESDPTRTFLQRSLEFNLQQNMLGICTKFKEDLCYSLNKVNTRQARYLSTLLSCLVDQAKQGYIFTPQHWDEFKRKVVTDKVFDPGSRKGDLKPKSKHIIDQLRCDAERIINDTLTSFHKKLPAGEYFDEDLTKMARWAETEAYYDHQWIPVLDALKESLQQIKDMWKIHFDNNKTDESKAEFGRIVNDYFERYLAIRPNMEPTTAAGGKAAPGTALTRLLLAGWSTHSEFSYWELLKASIFFASYGKKYVPNLVWWMAGRQLAYLKAQATTGVVPVAPQMYAMLKPDATYVKLRLSMDSYEAQSGQREDDEEADGTMEVEM